MVIDSKNTLQTNYNVLQDICVHRVAVANFMLQICKDDEDELYYQSEIRHYKFYEI
jgi:hypothetical protein